MNNGIKEKINKTVDVIAIQSDKTPDFYNQTLAASFLRTIIYFDVFSYPLTRNEIFEYSCEKHFDEDEGEITIEYLLGKGLIKNESGYFFIGDNNSKVDQRIKGNKLAEKRMKNARFFSNIIASFPFTRGVYISGSLSKGYMNEESDIDYFILTTPNRLWLCRTFLIMFKKIFLFNSHKNFCINYLVDTDNLEIKEQNLYTATEVAMLLPMHNHQLFDKFLEVNNWYKTYYPNYRPKVEVSAKGFPFFRRIMEIVLDNRVGDVLDSFFYKTTVRFWKNKHENINISQQNSELKWSKQVSQYHPRHYQFNVLKQFRKRIEEFEMYAGFPIGDC